MTKEQHKKTEDRLRWNKNVHFQYYICFTLILYILSYTPKFKFLSFNDTFNCIVNVALILSTIVCLVILFGIKLDINKVFLYWQYLHSIKEQKVKDKLSIATRKKERAEKEYIKTIESGMKRNNQKINDSLN